MYFTEIGAEPTVHCQRTNYQYYAVRHKAGKTNRGRWLSAPGVRAVHRRREPAGNVLQLQPVDVLAPCRRGEITDFRREHERVWVSLCARAAEVPHRTQPRSGRRCDEVVLAQEWAATIHAGAKARDRS